MSLCVAVSIGRNIKRLLERPDESHVFRIHRDRVFYVSELLLKTAEAVARDELASLGTVRYSAS